MHGQLEVVPDAGVGRDVPDPFDDRADALLPAEEDQVVLHGVAAQDQVIAVLLEVKMIPPV